MIRKSVSRLSDRVLAVAIASMATNQTFNLRHDPIQLVRLDQQQLIVKLVSMPGCLCSQ
jgi:hypothetical protein